MRRQQKNRAEKAYQRKEQYEIAACLSEKVSKRIDTGTTVQDAGGDIELLVPLVMAAVSTPEFGTMTVTMSFPCALY